MAFFSGPLVRSLTHSLTHLLWVWFTKYSASMSENEDQLPAAEAVQVTVSERVSGGVSGRVSGGVSEWQADALRLLVHTQLLGRVVQCGVSERVRSEVLGDITVRATAPLGHSVLVLSASTTVTLCWTSECVSECVSEVKRCALEEALLSGDSGAVSKGVSGAVSEGVSERVSGAVALAEELSEVVAKSLPGIDDTVRHMCIQLMNKMQRLLRYNEAYAVPAGLLLHGYSGCGKTSVLQCWKTFFLSCGVSVTSLDCTMLLSERKRYM
jgi:hypothetical protein